MDEAVSRTETLIETAKAEIMDALNQKAELAARRQRYETMLEQADVRRAEVTQKLLKFEAIRRFGFQENERSQIREGAGMSGSVFGAGKRAAGGRRRLRRKEQDTATNQKLSSLQQDYHTNRTRLESMRNLAERYEGYGGSIRRVMEVRNCVPGIHGVVADLISTTKKYETAIETALGGSQNIT